MLIQISIAALTLAGMFTLFSVGVYFLKKSQIESTATYIKETGNDERVTFSTNLTTGDTADEAQQKLQKFYGLAEGRKDFVFKRFEQLILEEEKKKAEAAKIAARLQEVKS